MMFRELGVSSSVSIGIVAHWQVCFILGALVPCLNASRLQGLTMEFEFESDTDSTLHPDLQNASFHRHKAGDGLAVQASNGRNVHLIWHMSRKNEGDPPFLPSNIETCLRAGATCEVDVRRCHDGFVLLHGSNLEDSTTGQGLVLNSIKSQISSLKMKSGDVVTDQTPLFLEQAIHILKSVRDAGHKGVLMLDLKVPVAEITESSAREFARILANSEPEGLLLNSGELEGIEALARFCPNLPRSFDPKALLKANPPINISSWEAVGRHVEEVDTKWRKASKAIPPVQVFINYKHTLAARRAGVDLIGRWTRRGNFVGIWTLDASAANVTNIMHAFLDNEAPPTQIITNTPFDLQALWAQGRQTHTRSRSGSVHQIREKASMMWWYVATVALVSVFCWTSYSLG